MSRPLFHHHDQGNNLGHAYLHCRHNISIQHVLCFLVRKSKAEEGGSVKRASRGCARRALRHSKGRHLDLALLSGLSAMGEQSRETYRICTLVAPCEGRRRWKRGGGGVGRRSVDKGHSTEPWPWRRVSSFVSTVKYTGGDVSNLAFHEIVHPDPLISISTTFHSLSTHSLFSPKNTIRSACLASASTTYRCATSLTCCLSTSRSCSRRFCLISSVMPYRNRPIPSSFTDRGASTPWKTLILASSRSRSVHCLSTAHCPACLMILIVLVGFGSRYE